MSRLIYPTVVCLVFSASAGTKKTLMFNSIFVLFPELKVISTVTKKLKFSDTDRY